MFSNWTNYISTCFTWITLLIIIINTFFEFNVSLINGNKSELIISLDNDGLCDAKRPIERQAVCLILGTFLNKIYYTISFNNGFINSNTPAFNNKSTNVSFWARSATPCINSIRPRWYFSNNFKNKIKILIKQLYDS